MARGTIQIRLVEDPRPGENYLNRQIQCGLFKRADKLSALCDAQISMFVVTETGKCFNYTSSSMSAKDLIDRYQRTLGIDLWGEHYERMEEELKKLKETNMSLRRQIGQRIGVDSLNDLSFEELIALEREMEGSLQSIRDRKHLKLQTRIEICKLKLRRLESLMENHLTGRVGAMDDPIYGVVDNGEVNDCRVHRINALIQLPNQPNHEGQTESCLTSDSSVSQRNLQGETESVRTPCSSLNPPDSSTSKDIQI